MIETKIFIRFMDDVLDCSSSKENIFKNIQKKLIEEENMRINEIIEKQLSKLHDINKISFDNCRIIPP